MAKRHITGILFDGARVAWATLAPRGGERFRRIGGGADALPPSGDAGAAPDLAGGTPEVLQRVAAVCHGDVVLGLPSDRILMRVLTLPRVDPDELADMATLQADKISPFPVETMVVSHEVLAEGEDLTVVVAAMRESDVEDLAAPLGRAGIRPGRMDVAILGRWSTLRDAGAVPAEGRAVLAATAGDSLEIIVTDDGVPRAMRACEPGATAEAAALAAGLESEIRQTLLTLEMEHGARPVQVAAWVPEEAVPGVAQALAAGAEWPVSVHALTELPDVAEGVARRGTGRDVLDLTPPAWLQAAAARRLRRRLQAGLVVVVGLWLAALAAAFGIYAVEKQRLVDTRAAREQWSTPALEVRALRERVLMLERYADTSHSALECLREISTLMPRPIEMTSFTYNKNDAVRLTGRSPDRTRIYDFKTALDESGLFTATELGNQIQDRRGNTWIFDMVLALPEVTE